MAEEKEEGFEVQPFDQGFAYLGEMRIRGRFVPDFLPRVGPASARSRAERASPRAASPQRNGSPRQPNGQQNEDMQCEEEDEPRYEEQHEHAALRIQCQWRGYEVRRKWKKRRLKFRQRRNKGGYEVMLRLVDDVIIEELIPRMLLEIFTHEGDEYAQYEKQEVQARDIFDSVCLEVVVECARHIAKQSIRELIDRYLTKKREREGTSHPLEGAMEAFLDDAFPEIAKEVVRKAMQEMVDEYLVNRNFQRLLEDIISSLLEEVAADSISEEAESRVASLLLQEVADEECEKIARSVARQEVSQWKEENEQSNKEALRVGATRTLDRAILRTLLYHLASNGAHHSIELLKRRFVDGVLFRTAIAKAAYVDAVVSRSRTDFQYWTIAQAMYPTIANAGAQLLSDMYCEWDRFVDYQDKLEYKG